MRIKSFIYSSEANILGIISNSLVHRTGKVAALKLVKAEISRISSRLKLNRVETNRLWLDSYKMYLNVSRRVTGTLMRIGYKRQEEVGYSEVLRQRIDATYKTVHKLVVQPGLLEKNKNELYRNVEHRLKHDELYDPVKGIIAMSRAKASYSPFFVCDMHKDCAKDHEHAEGKVYIDEDWKQYISDQSTVDAIQKYVRSHKIQTVQYITGAPTYLTTRNNCRHQLHNVEISLVLSLSAREIVKKNNLYVVEKKPMTYERIQYTKYYDRLKILNELQSITPCNELTKDIKATRKLCRIWANRAGMRR